MFPDRASARQVVRARARTGAPRHVRTRTPSAPSVAPPPGRATPAARGRRVSDAGSSRSIGRPSFSSAQASWPHRARWGSGFGAPQNGLNTPFYGTVANLAADVNGDGRADVIAVNEADVYVALSNGSGFGSPQIWFGAPFFGTVANIAADVNGDGKADAIAVNWGNVYVMLSNGSGFGSPQIWFGAPFFGTHATLARDVNGDGLADAIAVNSGNTYVMLSNGSSFGSPQIWLNTPFYGSH